jgi:hypothetical protein
VQKSVAPRDHFIGERTGSGWSWRRPESQRYCSHPGVSSAAVGVGVLGVECVYPLAVGVAFVEIFPGGFAEIGGKKLWWSVRKEVVWCSFLAIQRDGIDGETD